MFPSRVALARLHARFVASFVAVVVAVILLPCIPAAAQQPIVIDEFADKDPAEWPKLLAGVDPVESSNEPGLDFVFGGRRLVIADAIGIPDVDHSTLDVFIDATRDYFDVSSTLGGYAFVSFDYQSTPTDFTGQSHLRISLLGYDAPNGGSLVVTTFLTSSGLDSFIPDTSANIAGAQHIDISLAGVPADRLAAVTGVGFTIAFPAGSDARIERFTTIPEPSIAVLIPLIAPALAGRPRPRPRERRAARSTASST